MVVATATATTATTRTRKHKKEKNGLLDINAVSIVADLVAFHKSSIVNGGVNQTSNLDTYTLPIKRG